MNAMPHRYQDTHNFLLNKALYKKVKKLPDYLLINSFFCALFGENPSVTRVRAYEKEGEGNMFIYRSRSSRYEQILEDKIDDILKVCTQINNQIKTDKMVFAKHKNGRIKIQVPLEIADQLYEFTTYINLSAILRRMGHIPKGIPVYAVPTENFPNIQTRAHMITFNKILKRRLPKLHNSFASLNKIVVRKSEYKAF